MIFTEAQNGLCTNTVAYYEEVSGGHLVDIMMVEDAIEVFINVIEHVHHLHWGAVVAKGGETHNITKIDSDFIKQLRLHNPSLLQRAHHWAGAHT